MTRYTISIGLFDKDTKRQKFSENIAKNIVSDLLVEYIGYGTIFTGNGVYTHNDGSRISEPSIIIIYDGEESDISKVKDFAWCAKKALNQESVLLEKTSVSMEFV